MCSGVFRARKLPHRNWFFCWPTWLTADVISKRNPHIFSNGQGSPCCFLCLSNLYLGIWGCLVSISEITFGLPWLQRSFVVSSKNNILKSGGRTGNSGKFWWLVTYPRHLWFVVPTLVVSKPRHKYLPFSCKTGCYPPENYIDPENQWLGRWISFWDDQFSDNFQGLC